jgi:hypothetical protein
MRYGQTYRVELSFESKAGRWIMSRILTVFRTTYYRLISTDSTGSAFTLALRNLLMLILPQENISQLTIFWDITSCRPKKVSRSFGGTFRVRFQKPGWKKVANLSTSFHIGFLLGLFIKSENGDHMFLQNFCWLSTNYTTLYSIGQCTSYPPVWEPQSLQVFPISECGIGIVSVGTIVIQSIPI